MIRVEEAERNGRRRRFNEVDNWLKSVNSMEQKIEDIQQRCAEIVQVRCLDRVCQKKCLSSYNTGKEVVKTLDHLRKLMAQGQNFKNDSNIAYQHPPKPVVEMPVPKTVGVDSKLNMIWNSIEEENGSIIGLYGMGGAGKTTLMKKLNNELAKRNHDFTLVIWVVVSKDCDMDNIMEDIRRRCGISDSVWKNNERASKIYDVMKNKKFILLLDDIWEKLELHTLGVPHPDETNKSKILFTRRSENLCDQMQAKKFKVECLTDEEAFDLFCMKVGEKALNSHRDIQGLARKLAQECKGLPLALITVGQAMAGQKNPQAWEHAVNELKCSPSKVIGKEVFFILKFSYDCLRNDTEKECFLYCALYPNDQPIYIDDLIRFWIGEGFLGKHDCIHDAYKHGESIVESLKLACLLESEENDWVKMHDVIREMALWLARDQDQNKNKVLLQEALELSQANDLENWLATERILMMYDISVAEKIERKNWHVPIYCPHLKTLIVQGKICIKYFANIQCMSKLRVLSLVRIEGISTLPTEIGQLIHLEYLELSRMYINERFPIEMKNLKSLKVFLLQYVLFSLEMIPLEVISSLEKLKVFSFSQIKLMSRSSSQNNSSFSIYSSHTVEKSFLEQLELLPHLDDLSITLETTDGINKLLSSTKFQHCVTFMGLQQLTEINIPLISSMASLKCLEVISLNGLQDNMEADSFNCINPFCKLRGVKIENCHFITHLTWLKYAPNLLELIVRNCKLVEEVIKESDDDGIFSNLMKMRLVNLPKLKSIYKKPLLFSVLQNVEIRGCSDLEKLPLNSNSARNSLKVIKGEKRWWDKLKWENPAIKELFHSKFVSGNSTEIVLKMDLHDDGVKQEVLRKLADVSGIETISVDMNDSKLTLTGDDMDTIHIVQKLGLPEVVSVGLAFKENIEPRNMIKRSQVH